MAKYLYEVQLSNGQSYDVTMVEHHDDHGYEAFKQMLVNVLSQIVAGVATHHISKINFKGHR